MDTVFLELLNRSIAAGWLVLAVVAFRALLFRAPKQQRCHLWGLVLLRLLLPSLRKSTYSLIPSAQTIRPEMLLSSEPSIQTGFVAVDQAVNPVLAESFAPAVGDSVNPLQVWVHIGAVIWLCGLAAMLLYAVVSYLRLRRRVAESVPLRDNIRLSDRIASPFVLGILRPRIYLPFGLDEQTQDMVLAHEQGHIDRNDDWAKPFGFLFLALCWFHPLAWLAYLLFCRDLELACDEHVLRTRGPEIKKAYSAALLSCSTPRHSPGVCPLAFGQSDVKRRIRNVLAYRKPTFWIHLTGALAAALLYTCFLTDPAEAADVKPRSPFSVEAQVLFSSLERMELGGYEPITEADAARHADFSLLTLPELPDRFEPSGEFYAMDASGAPGLGSARYARLWFSPATEEALFASWLENPGRVDEPMSMAYWRLINAGGTGWANFLAESRGKVGDTDVVLRYYAADANTDPEVVRGFMENVELAPVTAFAPTASSPSIVTLPGLAAQSAGFDAELSVPVGGSAAVLPALGLANRRPSSIGMDIYDGGYCRIELNEAGQPFVLGMMPTELPVPIEVQFSKQTYRLAVTVEPDPSGSAAPLYNEPDPAAVDALQILFNDRPLSALTASAGRSYLLDTQALPGGAVKAEWTSSDESVARVTVRADGRCVLDALRETEEPVTITAAYGEHRAAFTLAIN